MGKREQLIKEIEDLPHDLVEGVYAFVASIQERRRFEDKQGKSWSDFSLTTGAFDFWNDPEEMEYSLEDLKERS
jgi:hypothetical protein